MPFFSKIGFKVLAMMLGIAVIAPSCIQSKKYPDNPEITFIDYNYALGQDSLGNPGVHLGLLTIGFTDGDGDLGLFQSETTFPYDYNIFVYRIGISDGSPDFSNMDTINYRIPYITPEGQNKTLIGEIDIELTLYPILYAYDTLYYEVYIQDRALNKSNTVTTPETGIE